VLVSWDSTHCLDVNGGLLQGYKVYFRSRDSDLPYNGITLVFRAVNRTRITNPAFKPWHIHEFQVSALNSAAGESGMSSKYSTVLYGSKWRTCSNIIAIQYRFPARLVSLLYVPIVHESGSNLVVVSHGAGGSQSWCRW